MGGSSIPTTAKLSDMDIAKIRLLYPPSAKTSGMGGRNSFETGEGPESVSHELSADPSRSELDSTAELTIDADPDQGSEPPTVRTGDQGRSDRGKQPIRDWYAADESDAKKVTSPREPENPFEAEFGPGSIVHVESSPFYVPDGYRVASYHTFMVPSDDTALKAGPSSHSGQPYSAPQRGRVAEGRSSLGDGSRQSRPGTWPKSLIMPETIHEADEGSDDGGIEQLGHTGSYSVTCGQGPAVDTDISDIPGSSGSANPYKFHSPDDVGRSA